MRGIGLATGESGSGKAAPPKASATGSHPLVRRPCLTPGAAATRRGLSRQGTDLTDRLRGLGRSEKAPKPEELP